MRASKNTAFRNGFCALLLRTDESARVYAPAERCYCRYYYNRLRQVPNVNVSVTFAAPIFL